MFQIMCKERNSWDDTISNEFQTLWKRWYQSTPNIVIYLCFIANERPVKQELIGFCDALGIYLWVLYNDGKKSKFSQINESKTKVSLMKPVTILKL